MAHAICENTSFLYRMRAKYSLKGLLHLLRIINTVQKN